MKKRILIIEDESFKNFLAIDELKNEFDVDIALSIEGADNMLLYGGYYDLIILDVIMAPSYLGTVITNGGIKTGLIYYKEKLINLSIPIILWTRNDEIINSEEWGKNVVSKINKSYQADQLLNAVKEIFKSNKE